MLISQAELSVCDVPLWKTGKTKNASNYGVVLYYSAQSLSVDKLPCMLIKLNQVLFTIGIVSILEMDKNLISLFIAVPHLQKSGTLEATQDNFFFKKNQFSHRDDLCTFTCTCFYCV